MQFKERTSNPFQKRKGLSYKTGTNKGIRKGI